MKNALSIALLLFFFVAACGTDSSTDTPGVTDTSGVDDTSGSDASGSDSSITDTAVEEDVDETDTAVEEDTVETDVGTEDTTEDVGEDATGEDTVDDADDDPIGVDIRECEDGEEREEVVSCEDGRELTVTCVCSEGFFTCGPDPCASEPERCRQDGDCAAELYCDECATSSCPGCDDCVGLCVPHGCETQSDDELTCRAIRFECDEGQVSIIRGGCWLCVDAETCEQPAGGGSDCEVAGATCYEARECPDGTTAIRSSCDPTGGICCQADISDCEASGATCLDVSECPRGTDRIRSSCEPTGGICCSGAAGICDDGSELLCDLVEPECDEFSILAVRDGCWECVNPLTCRPWGEAGCSDREPCPRGFECNFCATSSCPFCEDCVAACVPVE